MNYHIFDYYPFEVKKLKQLNKNTKEYKKELSNFIYATRPMSWEKYLKFDKNNSYFKEKYFKKATLPNIFLLLSMFLLFSGVFVINLSDETRDMLIWEFILFIIWFIGWIVLFVLFLIFELKARKILLQYISFLIDNYTMRKHNLTDEELSLVIEAFKNPHEQYDCSYHATSAGCLDCLKIFDGKSFDNGIYHNYECPYCKSDRLICKTENDKFELNKDLLILIKRYWE